MLRRRRLRWGVLAQHVAEVNFPHTSPTLQDTCCISDGQAADPGFSKDYKCPVTAVTLTLVSEATLSIAHKCHLKSRTAQALSHPVCHRFRNSPLQQDVVNPEPRVPVCPSSAKACAHAVCNRIPGHHVQCAATCGSGGSSGHVGSRRHAARNAKVPDSCSARRPCSPMPRDLLMHCRAYNPRVCGVFPRLSSSCRSGRVLVCQLAMLLTASHCGTRLTPDCPGLPSTALGAQKMPFASFLGTRCQ
jgi:hypothetical protein